MFPKNLQLFTSFASCALAVLPNVRSNAAVVSKDCLMAINLKCNLKLYVSFRFTVGYFQHPKISFVQKSLFVILYLLIVKNQATFFY